MSRFLSMGFFHLAVTKLSAKRRVKSAPMSSSPLQSPSPSPRSIEDLEQQMALEAQATQRQQPVAASANPKRIVSQLIGVALLIGLPLGALALINLPYAPIRRPIAKTAPFLLLPSYISMDNHFRQAITTLEEAKQLIDQATAPADLQLGEQKLKQVQASLDHLPTSIWSELPETESWWYGRRITLVGFNSARAELGRLQSKLFQEQNAQAALSEAEQDLSAARQQYQEASAAEKQAAILVWQDAQDKMRQIPAATLAGRIAQQKLKIAERDYRAIGGITAGNPQTIGLITAAKQFAGKAAETAQNPPYSVEQWQQVMNLWQQAISRLQQISIDDPAGYTEAQKLLVTYTANLGQIKVRQEAESKSVKTLKQAKSEIERLIATTPTQIKPTDRTAITSQLQRIINQLEAVEPGTTVYSEAQQLLKSAREKAKQF